jgi:hypothetical protein
MSFVQSQSFRLQTRTLVGSGVLAFALIVLQGCAAGTTASSLGEPGAAVVGLGPLRADPEVRSTARDRERGSAVRDPARHERVVRVYSACRQCGH